MSPVDNQELVEATIYGSFRKARGTLTWGPYNSKDPTIKGTILGLPYFRKPPYGLGFRVYQVQLLNNLRVNVQEPVEIELSVEGSESRAFLVAHRRFTRFHDQVSRRVWVCFAVADVGGYNRNI